MLKTLCILLLLVPFIMMGQYRKTRYKYELFGGLGTSNFLGDIGGANQKGTHLLKDYDYQATRPVISVGLRYRNHRFFAFKGVLEMGVVAGKDKYTSDKYRQNRNLSFSSPIIELSAQAEYYFIGEKRSSLYRISGVKNKQKRKYTMYIFTGIGAFFYSPSTTYNGQRYRLRKLHTEGQGLPGGPKQYSNFNICIPVGVGYKYTFDRRWSVGCELGFRKTFTDYIDDVSGVYYTNNNYSIQQSYGTIASALADPSLGIIPTATKPNGDGTGAQRGNPKYKDAYLFFEFNASYKFTKKRRTRSKF